MKSITKRILVVDNDPVCTRMVRLTLERYEGFDVYELNDPTHTLTTAGKFRPDLILLDVEMPRLNGGDVARRLQAVPGLKRVPIVFITSLLTEGETVKPLFSAGTHVLAKPVTMAKLVRCVAGMLGELCNPTMD